MRARVVYARAVRKIGGLGLALLLACTAHERPAPEVPPSPRAALAAALGLELPASAGHEPLTADVSVWIGPSELALTRADGTVTRGLATLVDGKVDGDPARTLFDTLLATLAPEDLPEQDRYVHQTANLFIDRRAPVATLVTALLTLGRAGITRFHLVGGTPDAPRAVIVDLETNHHGEPSRPIRELRGDLSLTWEPTGVRAWALPRSAIRPPFALVEGPAIEEGDPPPDPPFVAERVPLTSTRGSDPPLDLAATSRLATELCDFNQREPFGLQLEPTLTTAYDELIGFTVAAIPPMDCRGPRRLYMLEQPRRGPAIPLTELPGRVLPAQG